MKPRIAVLLGGRSREREISLRTGRAVMKALEAKGYEVLPIDPGPTIVEDLDRAAPDAVFIALHGRFGEDGIIQGLLEVLEIPYVGSGVLASAASWDKLFAKRLFQAVGIPTPRFVLVERRTWEPGRASILQEAATLRYPIVVKPSEEGSSLGMTVAERPEDLETAILAALTHGQNVLVEEFVRGKELTVGVIGNRPEALPPIEIRPRSGRYDFASKYTVGATEYIIPPDLPPPRIEEAKDLGLRAHGVLGCRGMSRVDMILGERGFEVLEVNTIPGMTETSLLPKAAAAAGIPFEDLCDRLVRWALEDAR